MAINASVNKISISVGSLSSSGELGYSKPLIKDDLIDSIKNNPGGDSGIENYAESLSSILYKLVNS